MSTQDNSPTPITSLEDPSLPSLTSPISFQLPQTKQIGNYTIGSEIGSGAFGKVVLGTHILTGETVAIKILDKLILSQTPDDLLLVQKEISILKIVKHKHIVQLYEIMETPRYIYIIMEYCEGKDLMDYILTRTRLTEMESLKLFQQLISALLYLHNQHIAHRDIKIDNMLLDAKMDLKLVDFGLSTKYVDEELLNQPCGTVVYAAPEVLEGKDYHGMLADVWSSGIVLFGMISGYLPFCDQDDEVNKQSVLNGDIELPEFFSDEVKDLLTHMLDMDQMKRYTLQDIQEHDWFNMKETIMLPGIVIGKNKIPIDERILNMIQAYGLDKETVRLRVQQNKFDAGTAMYYLLVKKAWSQGYESVSDLSSDDFIEFILDEDNYIQEQGSNEEDDNDDEQIQEEEKEEERSISVNKDVNVNDGDGVNGNGNNEQHKEEDVVDVNKDNDNKSNGLNANDNDDDNNSARKFVDDNNNNKSRTTREANLVSLISMSNSSIHSLNKKYSLSSKHNNNNDNNGNGSSNSNIYKENGNIRNEVIHLLKSLSQKNKTTIKETQLNDSLKQIQIIDNNNNNSNSTNNVIPHKHNATPPQTKQNNPSTSIKLFPPRNKKPQKPKKNKLNNSVDPYYPNSSSSNKPSLNHTVKQSLNNSLKNISNINLSVATSTDKRNIKKPHHHHKDVIASLTRPTKSSANKQVMHFPMTDRKTLYANYIQSNKANQALNVRAIQHTSKKDNSIKSKLLEDTASTRKKKVTKSMSIPNDIKKHHCITQHNSKSRTNKQIKCSSQQNLTIKQQANTTVNSVSISQNKKRRKYTKEDIDSISNRLYTSSNCCQYDRMKDTLDLSKLNTSNQFDLTHCGSQFTNRKDIKHLDSSVIQTRRQPSPFATRDLSYSPKQAILNEKSRLQKLPWKYKKNGINNNEDIPEVYKRYQDKLSKREHNRILNLKQYKKKVNNIPSCFTLTRKNSFNQHNSNATLLSNMTVKKYIKQFHQELNKSNNAIVMNASINGLSSVLLPKQTSSSRHHKNPIRIRTNTYYNNNNNNSSTSHMNTSISFLTKTTNYVNNNINNNNNVDKKYHKYGVPPIYDGPIDFSCIVSSCKNVKECLEYVKKRMDVHKIQYVVQNKKTLRFYCTKNGIHFDIEINRIRGNGKEEYLMYLKIRERQRALGSCRKFIEYVFA